MISKLLMPKTNQNAKTLRLLTQKLALASHRSNAYSFVHQALILTQDMAASASGYQTLKSYIIMILVNNVEEDQSFLEDMVQKNALVEMIRAFSYKKQSWINSENRQALISVQLPLSLSDLKLLPVQTSS